MVNARERKRFFAGGQGGGACLFIGLVVECWPITGATRVQAPPTARMFRPGKLLSCRDKELILLRVGIRIFRLGVRGRTWQGSRTPAGLCRFLSGFSGFLLY